MTLEFKKPTLEILNNVFSDSINVDIVSPFYSRGCLRRIKNIVQNDEIKRFSFWTKPLDLKLWQKGFAAPDILFKVVKEALNRNAEISIMVTNSLHAKLYLGHHLGAFGSSNLTIMGFSKGEELLCIVKANNLKKLENFRIKHIKPSMEELSIVDLEQFINENQDLVTIKNQIEDLINQDLIKKDGALFINDIPSFEYFIRFIETIDDEQAEYVVDVATRGKNNLIGHYRAFYLAVHLFYNKYPEYIESVFEKGSLFSLSKSDIKEYWIKFMDSRNLKKIKNFKNYNYTYKNIHNYLPDYLGGKQIGGGGGAGNLNRCLYFVATFRLFLEGKIDDL